MKKKTENDKMRRTYYELADQVPSLINISKELKDENLIKLSSEIKEKMNQLRTYLDENYIWD